MIVLCHGNFQMVNNLTIFRFPVSITLDMCATGKLFHKIKKLTLAICNEFVKISGSEGFRRGTFRN